MAVDIVARGLGASSLGKVNSILDSGGALTLDFTSPITLPSGQNVQLTNLGTATNPVIQLSIPQGVRGNNGQDGREIELQTTSSFIQWRYVGESTWTNLIALSSITGAKGETGVNGFSPTITINTQTPTEYILEITTAEGSFITPNLQGKDGSGGSGGITEAPTDGKLYGRKDLDWSEVNGGSTWGSITGDIANQADLALQLSVMATTAQITATVSAHDTSAAAHADIRTTLSGKVNIADVYAKAEVDSQMAKKLNLSGGTMTGQLNAGGTLIETVAQVRNSIILPEGTNDFSDVPNNTLIFVREG